MSMEIDKLVAEKIMGWKQTYTVGYPNPHTIGYEDGKGNQIHAFFPSTNLEHAFTALDKVCEERNWRAIIDKWKYQSEVSFKTNVGADSQFYGIAGTLQLAICQALLNTVDIHIVTDEEH